MSYKERLILEEENGGLLRDEHLLRYQFAAAFVKDKLVLDIACGSGYGSRMLAEAGAARVIGLDADKEAVAEAAKNHRLENLIYKEGRAEAIPEADGSAEIIVSFETIEHLKDQEKYLSELKRAVKDDGLVFISTPNKEVFKNRNPFHIKELTGAEFRGVVKKHFPFAVFLEQMNGMATFLKAAGAQSLKEVRLSGSGTPLYFLAVCSKSGIGDLSGIGEGRINAGALERLKDNPLLKLSDKIYPLFRKIMGK